MSLRILNACPTLALRNARLDRFLHIQPRNGTPEKEFFMPAALSSVLASGIAIPGNLALDIAHHPAPFTVSGSSWRNDISETADSCVHVILAAASLIWCTPCRSRRMATRQEVAGPPTRSKTALGFLFLLSNEERDDFRENFCCRRDPSLCICVWDGKCQTLSSLRSKRFCVCFPPFFASLASLKE